MTTSTLFSSVPFAQNLAGPPVPTNTVVNAGGLVTHVDFTLTVTPASGWAEASVIWGPDGVNFSGQTAVYCAPGAGSTTQGFRIHMNVPVIGGTDGAQYFQAEAMNVSPGATATLTVTY